MALAAALALSCLSCSQEPDSPQEHKIGAVLALTGRGASYGEKARNGMQLAITEVNAGKLRETPLRLVIEDSQSSRQQAQTAFRRLIDEEKVFVAVGFLLSDEVLSCAPLANQRKVVLFSPFAGSDDIKNAGDYVFRNRESASRQAEAIARVAVERFGEKRFAVFHAKSSNGISYRDSFVDAVVRLGIAAPPPTFSFEEGRSDYRKELTQIRAREPEAVYLAGLDRELGLILKQADEMGFRPQFFASAAAISPRLLEIAGRSAEGLVGGSAPFDPDSKSARVQGFVTAYSQRFGHQPDFLAANAYDAIHLIADQIRAGATDGEKLKAGLYTVRDYAGVGGRTTFDSFGEVDKPITLVQVRDGAFRPLAALAAETEDSTPRP
jgi:branched-chain amino acid transport system substrate-binding protein